MGCCAQCKYIRKNNNGTYYCGIGTYGIISSIWSSGCHYSTLI